MAQVIIHVDPTGPSPIGWAQAAGMPGDTLFAFKKQSGIPFPNIADYYPQVVLKPFTSTAKHAYDIVITDPVGATGIATIPGSVMNDNFGMEVYARNALGQPTRMLAAGRVALNGYAYTQGGPLSPATYEVGPTGATGPQGEVGPKGDTGLPGARGSRWYSGAGAPTAVPDDRVEGDMWLNESNGDVWRWSDATAMWAPFTGTGG